MQKTFITRRLLLFVGTLFCQLAMFAQSQVTGTVSDEHGDPIIGASVSIKGGSTGLSLISMENIPYPLWPATQHLFLRMLASRLWKFPLTTNRLSMLR